MPGGVNVDPFKADPGNGGVCVLREVGWRRFKLVNPKDFVGCWAVARKAFS